MAGTDTYTYDNVFLVSTPSGGAVTITSQIGSAGYTLTDVNLHPLQVGDVMTLGGGTYIFKGYNPDGSLLVQSTNFDANYYLFTNTDYTPTTSVAITEGSPSFCLLTGTLVSTPSGERPVQDIRPGDEVLTHDGQAVPVRWVGRQSLITLFNHRALPIVITAGALGDHVPSRDLHVSPDHAILIDDYLVHAQALVNGTTITVMDTPPAQLDYYHLELDTQRIIVADGTPVESFVDDSSRAGFDNYDEWVALGLEPQPAANLPHPRVKSARQLPAHLRERVQARHACI